MSERAVYVVAWDLRKSIEANRIAYWLSLIKNRSKQAPIVVVGTFADDLPPKMVDQVVLDATAKLTKLNKNIKANVKKFLPLVRSSKVR